MSNGPARGLLEVLRQVPDPRGRQGLRHQASAMLAAVNLWCVVRIDASVRDGAVARRAAADTIAAALRQNLFHPPVLVKRLFRPEFMLT